MCFIFMAGNLSDGYVAFGPYDAFDDAADAHEWQDGWIMDVQSLSRSDEA